MKINQIFFNTAMIGGLILVPATVLAQQSEPYRYGYGHGMMGWGGGMIFGPIIMIVVLVVVIALVVLLVRWLGGTAHGVQASPHVQQGPSPLDILKQRFARGEIDKDEYEERRNVLGE